MPRYQGFEVNNYVFTLDAPPWRILRLASEAPRFCNVGVKENIMPRTAFIFIILLSLAALAGCAPKIGASGKTPAGPLSPPAEATESSAIKWGKQLAVTKCIACHRFYFPKEYSPKEWDVILEQKRNRLSLTQSQVNNLAAFFKKGAL